MKITRNREHTINMGSYESLKVGSSVELEVTDPVDITADGTPHPRVYEKADEILGQALAADLKEAIELLPPGSTSYVLSWRQNA